MESKFKKIIDGIDYMVKDFAINQLVKVVPQPIPDDIKLLHKITDMDPKVAYYYCSNGIDITPRFDYKKKDKNGDIKLIGFRVTPKKKIAGKIKWIYEESFEIDASWYSVFYAVSKIQNESINSNHKEKS